MKKGQNIVEGIIRDISSQVGIPELQIILYDLDKDARQELDGVPIGSANSDDNIEPQIVDQQTPSSSGNFTFDSAQRPDAKTWIDFPGDRLGSVLTDQAGRFILEYSDDLFQLGEKERRPDLVLIVLGPDHSTGASVIARLLHYSYVSRNNAGRRESYIIHLDRSKELEAQEYDKKKRLGVYFSRLNSNEEKAKRKDRKKFLNLIPGILIPGYVSNNKRFVSPRASTSEVDNAIHTAITEGVSNLRLPAQVQSTIVHLGEEAWRDFGAGTAEEFQAKACDILSSKGIGNGLTRIRSLLSHFKAKEVQLTPLVKDSDDPDDNTEMPVIEDTSGARDFIAGRVLGQVQSLPVINKEKESHIIDDLATIKERINDLEMSGGPANVTAFRDFHSLQIAFKDVWTSALDGEMEEDITELYDRINEINDDYGDTFPNPNTLADLAQFEDFIATIDASLMGEELRADSIPSNVEHNFPSLTLQQWNGLNREGRNRLMHGVNEIESQDFWPVEQKKWEFDNLLRRVMDNPNYHTTIGRLQRLILDIDERLSKPYSFKYYKEYSVNYGILVNYRQEWRPLNYQVGRLVSTLPLAPGESRELKISHKIKLTRAEKEVRKSLSEQNYESSSTVKTELDVLAKMSTDSNFKMSASGSFTLGIGSIESASEFSHNQKAESQRQQKQINEATRKASEKVRQEREISVEEKTEAEFSTESTQKIHNPNNEVTVTYLMYELERRYNVSQTLHGVTPVIMVALDMPSPHEITEGWILEYAWILKRVLLDDQFIEAIEWIENGRQSQSVEIAVARATYERELSSLKNLEANLDLIIADRRIARSSIIGLERQKAEYEAGDDGIGGDIKDFFLSGGFSLFGSSGPDEGEMLQAAVGAAKSKLKYIDEAAEELASQQRAAKRESRAAGEKYTNVLKSVARRDTNIKQLQLHLRQNIFHYMHAIWETKHPDELFFQLVEQDVYHLGGSEITCRFVREPSPESSIPGLNSQGNAYRMECDPPEEIDLSGLTEDEINERYKKPLGSIAHVDQLLGFKGNYAIFPLKSCTQITDYMMKEYVDDYLGVRDPATELGVSSAELIDYAKVAIQDPEISDTDKNRLKELVKKVLSSPSHNTEEIILPTGQIYMEALKGEQALLEDFKLAHRGMDVLKVEEEIRSERLENLRKAARLTTEEPDFSDPDVDKSIVVEGNSDLIIDPD